MHEYSLARALVDRAVREAARYGAGKILGLTIGLGTSAHLDPDALRFNLRAAAQHTPAQEAEFHLVPGAGPGPVLESIELEEKSDVSGSPGPSGSAD